MATCTTCPYCGVGCGVLATPDGKGGAVIKGDPDHPANLGRLCTKGSALGETIGSEGRLLTPRLNGRDATWAEAIASVATAFSDAIREHGPDSVAIYGSGQLLTEDYYVANKFMKGFVGSANIDTNSRLCMASTVAGHKRAFGSDTVPGTYEDLEQADLVVLVGSNLAWCHPVLYQRLAAAKAARPEMKVVNIDPRRTATSDLADLHLALAPGSDVALFNGLLAQIDKRGAIDADYVKAHVDGLPAAVEAANAGKLSETDLSDDEISQFFDLWVGTEKVVTVFSQGVNQSTSGVDKVNAIINCHLATGRIGKPGMGPFSVTGQPNAMGGREVGGLSNMLACHLGLESQDHRGAVQQHWNAPRMATEAGLKAVDLFRACADGRIKALWIMSTNPAASMPETEAVKAAISATPFVAVSDMFSDTDTGKLANVLLPAAGWGEKSGTVTNSDRTISRQRAFLPVLGQARPDWRIISDVAAAMGWGDAFAYQRPADIFREHAALSGLAASLGGDFDISGLADISNAEYETFSPTRWPIASKKAGGRFFADGGFFTQNRRAKTIPLTPRPLATALSPKYPLRLNTGRVRDHWHTMTRTARSPRLNHHIAEPFVEIHPFDADRLGLNAADLAEVSNDHGVAVLRVLVTDRVRKGEVFVPMHWTERFASAGKAGALVTASVDPISGQPELKGATCAVKPYAPKWYGFALGRGGAPASLPTDYWALASFQAGWRAELASKDKSADLKDLAAQIFGEWDDLVSVRDEARGVERLATIKDGLISGAIFKSPQPVAVNRVQAMKDFEEGLSPKALLAGVSSKGFIDPGPTVCSCFAVGAHTISRAIETHGLSTLEEVGSALLAGTGCGSCKSEVLALIEAGKLKTVSIAAE